MKNILLLVHDDPGQEARLQAALDICRALEGHLICLDVAATPLVSGELFAVTVESALFAEERARQAENRERLQARLSRDDVSWHWIETSGTFAHELVRAARMADLIVLNRRLDSASFPDMRAVASEVVVQSGKAVVAVPEDSSGFRAGGRALVAWDGSEEAMNAIQAAIPLLQFTTSVTILEVDDGSIEIPAEEAAAYLSRHGIVPEILRRPRGRHRVGDVILAIAEDRRADYVVMGGFGHGRIVEALVGGVSRELLSESPLPVVMTH